MSTWKAESLTHATLSMTEQMERTVKLAHETREATLMALARGCLGHEPTKADHGRFNIVIIPNDFDHEYINFDGKPIGTLKRTWSGSTITYTFHPTTT